MKENLELAQFTPLLGILILSTIFATKFSPWKYSGVQTGNPQRVDAKVFSQGKQEVVLEEESMKWSQSTRKMDVVE